MILIIMEVMITTITIKPKMIITKRVSDLTGNLITTMEEFIIKEEVTIIMKQIIIVMITITRKMTFLDLTITMIMVELFMNHMLLQLSITM